MATEEIKRCEGCGTEFTRRDNPTGWIIAPTRWARKRYCSAKCLYENRGGEKHPAWGTGGRFTTPEGYVTVRNYDERFAAMVNSGGRVMEHRLVMAQSLGRPLERHETVHHINGERGDNRLENLQLHSGHHRNGQAYRCRDCGSHNVEAREL